MLDIKLIRDNPEKVKEALKRRGLNAELAEKFLLSDGQWRQLTKELDDGRAELNKASAAKDLKKGRELKARIKKQEERIKEIEKERDGLLELFPNIPADDVPEGKDESGNVVLREVGKKPSFKFEAKDYLTIAEALDVIDVKKAAAVAGSRFGYLKGKAALLEIALIKFAFDRLTKKGFVPVIPPVMIRSEVYKAIGRLAGEQKEERYFLEKDNLYLVGTSEHTILPLHLNETLSDKDLPKRYVGFSTSFRREAGSYGKDTKGILRVHQFDKVEMISFTRPEDSEKEHQFLLQCQEDLMKDLCLPYRVMQICAGDLGWTDYKQYDIETWLPGTGKYRETHSCSNTTDFQTRGMNTKYAKGGPSTSSGQAYVHALNATGLAMGRTIIAIIENYQTKDGNFTIPKPLQGLAGD